MVGVPGRSRGYRPCRQRKKGCDLKQPTCTRCRKIGLKCQYDEYRNFVKPSPAPTKSSNIPETQNGNTSGEFAIANLSLSITTAKSPSPDLLQLPRHLGDPMDYQERYYQLVWDVLLPQGRPSPQCQARYPLSSWIFIAHKLCREYPALRRSVAATMLSGVGRRDGRPELMELGLKMYVEALSEVRQHLQTIHGGNFAALIVAARSLAAYEVLYGAEAGRVKEITQVRSWHGHHLGESALLESMPPTTFVEGHDHQIFVDGRMQIAMSACTARKRTFINDPIWRTVPWSIHPKTSRDLLIDVMVQIPALLQDYDELKASLLSRASPGAGSAKMTSNITSTNSSSNRSEPVGKTADEQHSDHQKAAAAAPEVTIWDQASCYSILEACRRVELSLASWWREHAPHEGYAAFQARGYQLPTTDELVFTHMLTMYRSGCVFLHNTMNMLRLMADRGLKGANGTGTETVPTATTASGSLQDVDRRSDVECPEFMGHMTPTHNEVAQGLALRKRNNTSSNIAAAAAAATMEATTDQNKHNNSKNANQSSSDSQNNKSNSSKATTPPPPTDPHNPYTYCHHIAEAMEAFFQPEAGTFGAFNAAFPMGVSIGYLITATGPGKGMGSPAWNKIVSFFDRGEVGRALELFLLGSLRQWQEVARSE
ncbi:RNA polymerase II-specific transcription factor-like protein [Microdochium nivale]|nr:RNA polymerase II-specific transcription factor-like protein [Microdochium nivale]